MKRLAALLASLTASLILLVPLAAHPAFALGCGDPVTTNTTLTTDLTGCSGDGLDVQANNVTIDLNGHTSAGPASVTASTIWTTQGCRSSTPPAAARSRTSPPT